MADTELKIDIRKPNNQVSIIEIHGPISAKAEKALEDAYSQASQCKIKSIVLDFNDLGYMNSSGIGLLVTMLIRANRQKQRLLAIGLNEHYREIFELTRLDEVITIFNTEAEALASI
jgi:anti-sigma B factor antagonist